MKNHIITTLFLFIIVSLATGCQKFSNVKIEQEDNKLAFNFSDMGESNNSQYILYDIAVSRNDCPAENCVYWEIVRKQAYFDSLEYPLHINTIVYGSKPDAMVTTTVAKALSSGEYSVAASLGVVENDKFVKSLKVFQKFKLTFINNRGIHIDNIQ